MSTFNSEKFSSRDYADAIYGCSLSSKLFAAMYGICLLESSESKKIIGNLHYRWNLKLNSPLLNPGQTFYWGNREGRVRIEEGYGRGTYRCMRETEAYIDIN